MGSFTSDWSHWYIDFRVWWWTSLSVEQGMFLQDHYMSISSKMPAGYWLVNIILYHQVTTSVYNLILGKLYCDHYGTMCIEGNREYSCKVKFKEPSVINTNHHQVPFLPILHDLFYCSFELDMCTLLFTLVCLSLMTWVVRKGHLVGQWGRWSK